MSHLITQTIHRGASVPKSEVKNNFIWRSTWGKSIYFRQYLKSWVNNDISSIFHFIVKNFDTDISFYVVRLQIKENSIFSEISFAFFEIFRPACQLAMFLIFVRKNRQRVLDKILLLLCRSLIELKLTLRLS